MIRGAHSTGRAVGSIAMLASDPRSDASLPLQEIAVPRPAGELVPSHDLAEVIEPEGPVVRSARHIDGREGALVQK